MRDYQGCAARGLTQAETARELGVSRSAVSLAADRHGIVFTLDPRASTAAKPGNGCFPRSAEHKAAISAGMRKAWAKYDLNGRRRVLTALSPAERQDYVFLMGLGTCQAEALRSIKREDLIDA